MQCSLCGRARMISQFAQRATDVSIRLRQGLVRALTQVILPERAGALCAGGPGTLVHDYGMGERKHIVVYESLFPKFLKPEKENGRERMKGIAWVSDHLHAKNRHYDRTNYPDNRLGVAWTVKRLSSLESRVLTTSALLLSPVYTFQLFLSLLVDATLRFVRDARTRRMRYTAFVLGTWRCQCPRQWTCAITGPYLIGRLYPFSKNKNEQIENHVFRTISF